MLVKGTKEMSRRNTNITKRKRERNSRLSKNKIKMMLAKDRRNTTMKKKETKKSRHWMG